jgi:hypothetical protein
MEKALENLKESEKLLCELLERSIDSDTVQKALDSVRDAISVLTAGRGQATIGPLASVSKGGNAILPPSHSTSADL